MNITQEQYTAPINEGPANHPKAVETFVPVDPKLEFDRLKREEAGLPEVEDIKCELQDVDTNKHPPVLKESYVTITFFRFTELLETEAKWKRFTKTTWYKIYNWFNNANGTN